MTFHRCRSASGSRRCSRRRSPSARCAGWRSRPSRAPGALIALQALHGMTFGMFWSAAIALIAATVPASLRATGQALLVMSINLGGALGNAITGRDLRRVRLAAAVPAGRDRRAGAAGRRARRPPPLARCPRADIVRPVTRGDTRCLRRVAACSSRALVAPAARTTAATGTGTPARRDERRQRGRRGDRRRQVERRAAAAHPPAAAAGAARTSWRSRPATTESDYMSGTTIAFPMTPTNFSYSPKCLQGCRPERPVTFDRGFRRLTPSRHRRTGVR